MKLKTFLRAACAASLCFPLLVSGGTYTHLDIYVRGEIFAIPCKVNNGQAINVDFGEVTTTYINDDNYSRKLDYRIECTDNRARGIKMYISGTASPVDARWLTTSTENLAVMFKADGRLLPLREKMNLTYPVQPDIQVVLARKQGVKLASGDFSANATIHIEYE